MTIARSLAPLTMLGLIIAAPALAQQSPADGERLFRARCGACHAVQPGQNRLGPHLAGLFGRAAGSVEGARYSEALRTSGLVWNDETLDRYLANPRGAVAGTTMTVSLPDGGQRAAIIAYLRSLTAAN
jgi:cytochrome c